jgi:proline iminopeptidase
MIGRRSNRLLMVSCLLLGLSSQATVAARDSSGTGIEEGFVKSHDGHRLHYRKVGNGKDAVLVPIDLYTFDGLRALARANRTLIFYDPRNRGRSEAVSNLSTITVENDVRDMDTLRRHFRLEKMSLIGYSVYGMEVALYATEHPDRVNRLVQLGPVPLRFGTAYPPEFDNTGDQSPFDERLRKQLETMRADGRDASAPKEYCRVANEYFKASLVTSAEALERLQPTIDRVCDHSNEWPINFRRQLKAHFEDSVMKMDVPWSRLTSRVTMPVLTIHGRKDRNAPYGAGREWATRLPDARFFGLDSAAHQSWVDDPEAVLGAIDEFLDGRWPKAAIALEKPAGP